MPSVYANHKAGYFLEPITSVAKTTPEETIGSILHLSESSHEPVFVFENLSPPEKFAGLISPYSALYKSRQVFTTEVSKAFTIPSEIQEHTSIVVCVHNMLSTRFYSLPVFDKDINVIGIIRAKKIIKELATDPVNLYELTKELKVNRPITIKADAKVKDAYKKLRTKGITRLVVVGDNGQLIAILTRNDLKDAFIDPSPRQRFTKAFGNFGQLMFDGEEVKRGDLPIANFYKNDVVKGDINENVSSLIQKLISSGANSVVQIDKNNQPVGFISIRDILLAISRMNLPITEVPIVMRKPKAVSNFIIEEIYEMLFDMGDKLSRRLPLKRFEIGFKEGKVGIGRPTLVETTLGAKFYSGDDLVVKTASWGVLTGVREAVDRIYKKTRRMLKKKHDAKTHLELDNFG